MPVAKVRSQTSTSPTFTRTTTAARTFFDPSGSNVTFTRLKTVGQAKIMQNGSITMISPIQLAGGTDDPPPLRFPVVNNPVPVTVSVPANAAITGVIDGVYPDGRGAYYIAGWACLTHDPAAIPVDLYLNGSAGAPGAIGIARFSVGASRAKSAVAAACLAGGASYRFAVPLSLNLINSYHGRDDLPARHIAACRFYE